MCFFSVPEQRYARVVKASLWTRVFQAKKVSETEAYTPISEQSLDFLFAKQ